MPPLLILGGISGAGIITLLEDYRPIFMVATFGLLGSAFYLTYRPRPPASGKRARMAAINKTMLWAVTGITVLMLCFPQAITFPFTPAGDVITADMQRTVIQIEGMT